MIPSPTDTEALANRINLHTRDAHNKVDKRVSLKFALVMRHDFIYIDLLKDFYLIFYLIENKIDLILSNGTTDDTQLIRTKEILKQFYVDKFRRSEAIAKDLRFFQIDPDSLLHNWQNENLPPRLMEFLQYIDYNIDKNPLTVLSYCHVLYLALFAGGKIFKSSFMRNMGFLNNYETTLDRHELITNVTNFFNFDETTKLETGLKLKYKENYELATRGSLTELEKLMIIDTSRDIFRYVYNIFEEIGQLNKEKLLSLRDFKIISFLLDEWKYNDFIKTKYGPLITFIKFLLIVICCFGLFKVGKPLYSSVFY